MATSQYDGYKFPHEAEDKEEQKIDVTVEGDDEDIKIEVVDDTPPEDRNINPLPEAIKEELEKIDESEDYSNNVKTKFKQYKKAWHDERRLKEAAFREQSEALEVAQRMLDENNKLKNILHNGEKELIGSYQNAAEMEVDKAKRSYTIAYETGDSDKLLEAQQELFRAELKLDKAKNYRPTVQPPQNSVQTPQKQPQAVQMDPKVSTWVTKNQWYVDPSKKAMSNFARGIHEELEDRYGKAFVGTDEYFRSIDKEVQRRFPEEFGSESNNDEAKPQRTKPSTVVASAKRSTAPKKVVLRASQVNLAKKFGLTNEQYAREYLKLEA